MKAYSSYTIIDVIDGLQWQGDLDAAPENPKEGWAYYNTQTKMSYIYDGEKWVVFVRDGERGPDGASVSAITEQYYISESNTIAPAADAAWSNEFPVWTGSTGTGENKKSTFVWKRTKTQLTQDSTISYKYSAPILMNQYDAATMAAQKAGLDIGTWCSNNDVTIIDGSAIATGTLDADRIKANTITSDQIAAKGITAGSLNVTELSTITANMGVLNAGVIKNTHYKEVQDIISWTNDESDTTSDAMLSYTVDSSTKTATVAWNSNFTGDKTAITTIRIKSTYTSDDGTEYPVAYIKARTFKGTTSLSRIFMPNTIITIGSYAFQNCTSLQNVVFPSSLENINSGAVQGCSGLKNLCFPANVITAGSMSFYGVRPTQTTDYINVYITDIKSWCQSIFWEAGNQSNLPSYNLYLNGKKLEHLTYPSSTTKIPSFSNSRLIFSFPYIGSA